MDFKAWLSLEKEDLQKRIKSYSRYRLVFFTLVVLGFLWANFWLWQKTHSSLISTLDRLVIDQLAPLQGTSLRDFFAVITFFGSGYFIFLLSLVLMVLLIKGRRKRAALVSLLTFLGSFGFVYLMKNFFGRERPFGCLDLRDCHSFPSGHTTIAYYFYGLIDYLIFRFLPISLRQFLLITLALGLLILLVALSRVVLLVHYPSDLLAGFFLGNAWLLLAIFLLDLLYS